MKHNKSLLVCCLLLILSSTATNAQPYVRHLNSVKPYPLSYWDYADQMIILRSDQPSQSALLSNLLADKPGDMSPIIGAALWQDSGRQLECRSLLKFNYDAIPEFIIDDPSLITSAQLILFPLQVLFSQNDNERPAKFIVRRVLDNWEDSATTWIHQPSADSSVQVSKVIKVKDKNTPVSVDVTKLVKKMLRSSNNGFFIFTESSPQELMASGQIFASPNYGFEEFRPLLIIDYRGLERSTYGFNQWNREISTFPITRESILMPPVREPVMEPVKEPVTQPVKDTPIKTIPVKD